MNSYITPLYWVVEHSDIEKSLSAANSQGKVNGLTVNIPGDELLIKK